jgi:hypothetical protein
MKKLLLSILFLVLFATSAIGQSSVLLPNGKQQFFDANGNPLGGGSVGMYVPSTLTPKTTWTDSDNSAANVNPVPLDSAGTALIYGVGEYRQIVQDALGNTIWDELTEGEIPGIPWGGTSSGTGDAQILANAAGFTQSDGKQIAWRSGGTNTTAATLQVGSVGTYAVYQDTGAGPVAVVAGALTADNIYVATYDSTLGGLQLVATSVGPFTVSGGTIVNSDITLKSSAAPSPTVTGRIEYDTTFDAIAVGDGAATDKYWPGVIAGTIANCGTANNAADATNDIDFAAGCTTANSTALYYMAQPSAYTKRLDANWTVGTGNGMLDTGAVANATYHLFQIMRPDTGVVDYLASLSPTAPTMPANYTVFRRIASIVRSGGVNVAYIQNGDIFTLSVPVANVSTSNPGTAAITFTTSVPTGIVLSAYMKFLLIVGARAANTQYYGLLTALNQADTGPGLATSNAITVDDDDGNAGSSMIYADTNTSAQLRYRVSSSNADLQAYLATFGWVDQRGR